MMTNWFSTLCPFFPPSYIEIYRHVYGADNSISEMDLAEIGMQKAALWLKKHNDKWLKLQKRIPEIINQSQNGRFQIISFEDSLYPRKLKNIFHPPALLFIKGDLKILDEPSVSIVGTRLPTQLGRDWIRKEIPVLVANGITIISGGARGIDAEAHLGVIRAGGRTVAVLPGGVDNPYPVSHKYIFDQIQSQGLLLSEFPPGSTVRPECFFQRNRLIAALADMVVIVEAGLKSGTMLTANHAIAENIDLGVVPGSPLIENYAGSLSLFSTGAAVIRDGYDVLDCLTEKKVLKKTSASPNLGQYEKVISHC